MQARLGLEDYCLVTFVPTTQYLIQACTGWQATLAAYGAVANNALRMSHLTTAPGLDYADATRAIIVMIVIVVPP